jgi:hypothetical protein
MCLILGICAGGIAAERGLGKDASAAADALGEDFYKVILQEEPFKSTQVKLLCTSRTMFPVGYETKCMGSCFLLRSICSI